MPLDIWLSFFLKNSEFLQFPEFLSPNKPFRDTIVQAKWPNSFLGMYVYLRLLLLLGLFYFVFVVACLFLSLRSSFLPQAVLMVTWPKGQNLSGWPGLLIHVTWPTHTLH